MSLSAFSRQFLLLLFAAAILWQRAGAGTETEEQSVVVVLRDFLQTGAPDAVLLALLDGAFKVEVLEHEELVEGVWDSAALYENLVTLHPSVVLHLVYAGSVQVVERVRASVQRTLAYLKIPMVSVCLELPNAGTDDRACACESAGITPDLLLVNERFSSRVLIWQKGPEDASREWAYDACDAASNASASSSEGCVHQTVMALIHFAVVEAAGAGRDVLSLTLPVETERQMALFRSARTAAGVGVAWRDRCEAAWRERCDRCEAADHGNYSEHSVQGDSPPEATKSSAVPGEATDWDGSRMWRADPTTPAQDVDIGRVQGDGSRLRGVMGHILGRVDYLRSGVLVNAPRFLAEDAHIVAQDRGALFRRGQACPAYSGMFLAEIPNVSVAIDGIICRNTPGGGVLTEALRVWNMSARADDVCQQAAASCREEAARSGGADAGIGRLQARGEHYVYMYVCVYVCVCV